MYAEDYRLNFISDFACLAIGFYNGAMNAKDINADVDPLVYTCLATSVFRGVIASKAAKNHNKDPYFFINDPNHGKKLSVTKEGLKHSGFGTIVGTLEIAVGYGIGWTLAKVL